MNQLAKLDFWNYLAYRNSPLDTTVTESATEYIMKASNWRLTAAGSPLINYRTTTGAVSQTTGGEVWYDNGSIKKSSWLTGGTITSTSALNTLLNNSYSGFEVHHSFRGANAASGQGQFSVGSLPFVVGCNSGGVFCVITTHISTNLFLSASATAGVTVVSQGIENPDVFIANTWRSTKVRLFVLRSQGAGVDRTYLYVKIFATEGAKSPLGYCVLDIGDNSVNIGFNINGVTSVNFSNNISIYGITAAQATTYATNIATNDLLPFQRYTPLLDLIPIFGTGWTGSDGTAAQDLTDGDLTTYATTEDKDTPIGFIASDGLTNVITNAEWFMVAAGGVGVDFSSVGGPVSGVLHDVFLATSGATIGTDSVYPLLTMGDLMGRTYAWTPGGASPTQLPTIGIIRNGSSMAFSVANTEAEDIRFKLGVPVDGDNINAFNYVQADVTTGGNPFGETLAVNHFDNGSGEFTDTIDTATVVSGKKYIVVLAGDGQNLSAVGGPVLASTGDTFVATSSGTLAGNYVRVQYTYTTAQPVIFTLERKT